MCVIYKIAIIGYIPADFVFRGLDEKLATTVAFLVGYKYSHSLRCACMDVWMCGKLTENDSVLFLLCMYCLLTYGDLEYCSRVGSNCVLQGPLVQVLVSEQQLLNNT